MTDTVPIIGPVHVTERHIVTIGLSPNGAVVHTGLSWIAPASVVIEYLNGKLWLCTVRGKKVREDGHEYLDGSYAGRSFMQFVKHGAVLRHRKLADQAPGWVRELVDKYAPEPRVSADERNW